MPSPLQEFDYELEVEGTLPTELRGTLFRNGPVSNHTTTTSSNKS